MEKIIGTKNGLTMLISLLLLMLADIVGMITAAIMYEDKAISGIVFGIILTVLVLMCIAITIMFGGLRLLAPNDAYVLTLFGDYYGTLKGPGYFFVNPFCSANKPAPESSAVNFTKTGDTTQTNINTFGLNKKISLKALTLNNEKLKINDLQGNPVIVGIVVVWRVVDTYKAIFDVDNYSEFLSIQSDSVLRNIVKQYPYDSAEVKCLRDDSMEIADELKIELQDKVNVAGLEIIDTRITHLAYSEEIASAMLQRQQAKAIVDARSTIVEGAVGMVQLALENLKSSGVVELDEERKATMVSNLLVVLCANKEATPVVNSGSLY
ncbi:MAG: SPFH domain-containing protein [Ruminococcus sp.]|jgi:regulator of protease activity HflC (stomatin/prohibitin superfamily)|nr:SPFH domain-containing protein [Ruminococcus sp.]